jgi:hypothetical protein
MNYFDLAVDENALWVMFHYELEDFIRFVFLFIKRLISIFSVSSVQSKIKGGTLK